jgi:hypothetical protein
MQNPHVSKLSNGQDLRSKDFVRNANEANRLFRPVCLTFLLENRNENFAIGNGKIGNHGIGL